MKDELKSLRRRLGAVNRRLLRDLNERLRLVEEVRLVKVERGLPFHDPAREAEMLRALSELNEGPLTKAQLERIFRDVFAVALEHLEAGKGKRRPSGRSGYSSSWRSNSRRRRRS